MQKTVLITGSTDGIGLETAKLILQQGHRVLLHGRNAHKLEKVQQDLSKLGEVESYVADLSDMQQVRGLASAVAKNHRKLDILINNAGVYKTPHAHNQNGLDMRFAVNTLAPYVLTSALLPYVSDDGRIINLSSAAQAPVNLKMLTNEAIELDAMDAYAQSKLALTMWSFDLAEKVGQKGPAIIAVNPGSLLASKMVQKVLASRGKT